MGAGNVALVYANWSGPLADKHRAFRILTYMALTSLDADKPPRFWGGRDALAHAIGRDTARMTAAERHAAFEAVRSGTADLITVGAVELGPSGRVGRNSEYLLHLWKTGAVEGASGLAAVTTLQAHPVAARRSTLRDSQGDPAEAQAHPVPKEEQEDLRQLDDDQQPRSATHRPVDAASVDDDSRSSEWAAY